MDSDGIWKACTTKVMTKTAMTTVASKDCSDLNVSAGECFSIFWTPGSLRMLTALHTAVQLRWRAGQIIQHLARRILLRILLGGTIRPAHEFGLAVIVQRL